MLVQQALNHIQPIQKALSQMNLQLHHVLSDITGNRDVDNLLNTYLPCLTTVSSKMLHESLNFLDTTDKLSRLLIGQQKLRLMGGVVLRTTVTRTY